MATYLHLSFRKRSAIPITVVFLLQRNTNSLWRLQYTYQDLKIMILIEIKILEDYL